METETMINFPTETITYKGKDYPMKVLFLTDDDNIGYTISVESLEKALEDENGNITGEAEKLIDETIGYYVPDLCISTVPTEELRDGIISILNGEGADMYFTLSSEEGEEYFTNMDMDSDELNVLEKKLKENGTKGVVVRSTKNNQTKRLRVSFGNFEEKLEAKYEEIWN